MLMRDTGGESSASVFVGSLGLEGSRSLPWVAVASLYADLMPDTQYCRQLYIAGQAHDCPLKYAVFMVVLITFGV